MSHSRYLKPLIAIAGLTFSVGTLAADWTVVPETSSVSFTGIQQGTKFTGKFGMFTAKIDLDAADPTKGSIMGVVQTATVNTRDADRDTALVDKDWFDCKQFPEARFESEKITRASDGSYEAEGKLTLKGQTKPATMKFTLTPAETSGGKASTAQFAGTMALNRFDYNVGEGWNDTSWVGQDVSVDVKLDLKR